MNIICTICTELITQEELECMYITPCGHLFHLQCISQWINRSPCCPQCRQKVTKKLMCRVYPTLSEEPCHNTKLTETLLITQQKLNEQIIEKDAKLAETSTALEKSLKKVNSYKNELIQMKQEISSKYVQLEIQKNTIYELQKDKLKFQNHITSRETKLQNKLAAVKDKYRYQVKRNIEWRKHAKRKQKEQYRSHQKRRKHSTSSSDSLSETDSPSTESESDTESSSSESMM